MERVRKVGDAFGRNDVPSRSSIVYFIKNFQRYCSVLIVKWHNIARPATSTVSIVVITENTEAYHLGF